MKEAVAAQTFAHADEHQDDSKTMVGFWSYIMTDCILFACLFATYAVLRPNTYGGPAQRELIHMPFVLAETLILLTSSFTCGLALLAGYRHEKKKVLSWLFVTFLLGAAFLTIEFAEFQGLIDSGNSWKRSAFLSSFFTLVGTHGLHIISGLLWVLVLAAQIIHWGVTSHTLRRLMCFGIFWHFLDVVWIFIFTIVYLMGAL